MNCGRHNEASDHIDYGCIHCWKERAFKAEDRVAELEKRVRILTVAKNFLLRKAGKE